MALTTRHRLRDSRAQTYRTVTEVDTYWHSTTTRDEPISKSGVLETIDDNNNHSFSWAVKNNLVIMSDCVKSKWERSYTSGFVTASSNTWTGTVTDDVTGSISGCPTLPTNLAIDGGKLLLQAYGKMNGSAIVSGELLNDLGATISMLRRPFRGAKELLNHMIKYRSKRVGKTAKSAMKASADAWLEYRYGWKPLILDANSIIKEVHKKRELCKVLRLVARAGGSDSLTTSYDWSATALQKCSGSCTLTRTVRCGVGVLYDLKPRTTTNQLNQTLGTRSRDLIPTLWEIVPYSFVVDWFTPIGPWLGAVMPDPDINVRGHWISTVSTRKETISGSLVQFAPDDWHGSCGSHTVITEDYSRLCNTPLPSPFASPTIALSRLHQIDAVSLLVQPIMTALKTLKH